MNINKQSNVLEAYLGIICTIRMIRKLKNVIYVGFGLNWVS